MALRIEAGMSQADVDDQIRHLHYSISWCYKRIDNLVANGYADATLTQPTRDLLTEAYATFGALVPQASNKCARCGGETKRRMTIVDKNGETLVIHDKRECRRSGDMLA